MTDLKDFSGLCGQFSEGVRLVQCCGNRLFDQNMPSGPKGLARQGKVIFRRGCDDDCIDLIQQIFVTCGNSATNFTRHDRCAGWIGVVKRNKLFYRICGGLEGMEPSEMAGSDDTDPKLLRSVHADTLISQRVSRKGSEAPKRQKVASAWRKRHGPGLKMI